jgi:predicted amidohydrolase
VVIRWRTPRPRRRESGKRPARGAQIVCTQELYRSRYFCQTESHEHFALAESIPGPTTESLQALAKELGVVIVGSLFEKRAEGCITTPPPLSTPTASTWEVPEDAHPG